MPAKYAEGTISPTGQFIVQGGQWVPMSDAQPSGPPTTEAGYMASASSLPKGSAERERALNMAVRLGEPRAAGTALAMTGAMAGAGAIPRALSLAATPAGGATIGAVEGIRRGPVEAVKGAVIGAAGGPALSKAGRMLQFLGRFKGAAPAVKAATTVATKAPAAVEEGAVQALRSNLPMTQDELGMLMQLKGHMQTAAGRLAAKEAVKEVFPNNWQEVWKFLTAGRTTMAGRLR